jgi:hypothetical protein
VKVKVIAIREDAMKGKVKILRIVKAMQIFLLGCQIELKRKRLELMIKVQNTFSSDSVVRKSNELSKLGIKWMALSADTEQNIVRDWS